MKKTVLGILLTLTAVFAINTQVMAKDGLWSGTGTEDDPYLIEDEADLKSWAGFSSHYAENYFKVTDDITLTEKWTPVGSNNVRFMGTFDGGGHTISGLDTYYTNQYCGLFGYNSGVVKNVNIKGSAKGRYYVGLAVGYNTGTVENVHCSGTVEGISYIGGAVGHNNKGTVKNVYSSGEVNGELIFIGGTVGYNRSGGVIENCVNVADVTGSGRIGGIVGGSVISATIKNCCNLGLVQTGENVNPDDNTHNSIGGIVGYDNDISDITNCSNLGWVMTDSINNVGGIAGYSYNSYITDCDNAGGISSTAEGSADNTGAIVGMGSICRIEDCWYDNHVSTAANGENDLVDAKAAVIVYPSDNDVYTVSADGDTKEITTDWRVILYNDNKVDKFTYTTDEFNERETALEADFTFEGGSKAVLYRVTSVSKYDMGDVNKDGNVDEKDAAMVLRAAGGNSELSFSQKTLADVYEGDSVIDVLDVIGILGKH